VLQHGLYYATEHQRNSYVHPSRLPASPQRTTRAATAAASAAAAAPPRNTMEWLAREIGIAGIAQGRTEEVVRLLTASPALLQDPRELSRVAKAAGHPLEPAAAGKFAERVLLDEAAYSLLQEHHYKAFLHRLHTRAPVPTGGGGGAAAAAAAAGPAAAAAAAAPVSQPVPLAAVAAGGKIVSKPAVAVAAPAAPASPRASRSGAAAPFVERTPPGGESKQERKNRLGRNRKRKRRADPKVKEAQALAAWQKLHPGKDTSERKRRRKS